MADTLYAEIRLALARLDRTRGNVREQAHSHADLLGLLEGGDLADAETELAGTPGRRRAVAGSRSLPGSRPVESQLMKFVLWLVVNAAALGVAVWLFDGITLTADTTSDRIVTLLIVGAIFGVVTSVVRPIVNMLSLPLIIADPRALLAGDQRAHADADQQARRHLRPRASTSTASGRRSSARW